MANAFYNRGASFNPDELADGDAIEAEFDAVGRGFDTIEDLVDVNKAGHTTQTFHVAPATEPTHAVQKDQLDDGLGLKLDADNYNATDILTKIKTVDGSGSGLDADLLDGQEGSYYRNASNINDGTLDKARLPASVDANTTGNAATATKLATARTINGVAFDGTANITVADSTKLPLTGGVLTGGLCIGDGTASANPTVVGDLEHYLEVRGTTATYPSALGVAFHHEGISASALVHGQLNGDTGYFNLRTDDTNLKVYFKDQEVWDSVTGLRASRSAVGVAGNYTNWDSLTLHGVYNINSPNFVGDTNPPPSTYGYGILHTDVAEFDGQGRIMQIYYPHNQDLDRYFYQRMRNTGVWTAWAKIWRGGTGPHSGLVASKVSDIAPSGDGRNLVEATMASNDFFRIRAYSTADDLGEVEIATADWGIEPIHVRQYTGVFASAVRTLTLLDGSGNTVIPGGVWSIPNNAFLNTVSVITGTVYHGNWLPIPDGYSEGQCRFFISMNNTNPYDNIWDLREGINTQHYSEYCRLINNRQVEAFTRVYNDVNDAFQYHNGIANYIVIGVK